MKGFLAKDSIKNIMHYNPPEDSARCIIKGKMNNRDVYIGLGFHSDVDAVEIEKAIHEFLEELGIGQNEVKGLCTVDFKNTEELQEVSAKFGIPILLFTRDEINSVNVRSRSAAMDVFNIKGVAEPCAILGANRNKCKIKFVKRKSFNREITPAVVPKNRDLE